MSIASFFGKRPREAAAAATSPVDLPSPRRLCCWNANSLLNRIQKDGDAFATFLTTHSPDVIFMCGRPARERFWSRTIRSAARARALLVPHHPK